MRECPLYIYSFIFYCIRALGHPIDLLSLSLVGPVAGMGLKAHFHSRCSAWLGVEAMRNL